MLEQTPEMLSQGVRLSLPENGKARKHLTATEGGPDGGSEPLGRQNRLRILFVDDDENVLDSLGRLLELERCHVDKARDGLAGVELARRWRYDVILLDLNLPDGNGLVTVRQLRLEGVSAPVVVLTGWGSFEAALEAGRLGVSRFLSKPVLGRDLIVALRAAAESASALPSENRLFAPATGRTSDTIVGLRAAIGRLPEREQLIKLLARAAQNDSLTFFEFLGVAKALQYATSQSDPSASWALERCRRCLDDAGARIVSVSGGCKFDNCGG